MTGPVPQRERLPPRTLPWLWFLFGHLSLLTALATLAVEPAVIGDFYYHPKAVALVHLVTLGWISCNIVGSLYLVGPVALRTRLEGGTSGAIAFALAAIGIIGMVAHFWLDAYSGMIWAAGTVLAGLLVLGIRAAPTLLSSDLPATVRWHVGLAFTNLVAATLLGMAIGLEKLTVLTLPGPVLGAVRAHAHLAAIGWALMMVMGIGYRLLPMQLPSAIPERSGPRASAWLLEAGLLGLVAGAMFEWVWVDRAGALMLFAALAVFARQLLWMTRNRRNPAKGLPSPDLAMALTVHAIAYLAVSAATGLLLLWLAPSALTIRLTFVYGVAGLLGFLSQIILGVGGRLLPLTGWMRAFVEGDFEPPDLGLHELPLRGLQWCVLVTWVVGLPALTWGLATGAAGWTRAGACALLIGALADGVNRLRIWRHSRSRGGATPL